MAGGPLRCRPVDDLGRELELAGEALAVRQQAQREIARGGAGAHRQEPGLDPGGGGDREGTPDSEGGPGEDADRGSVREPVEGVVDSVEQSAERGAAIQLAHQGGGHAIGVGPGRSVRHQAGGHGNGLPGLPAVAAQQDQIQRENGGGGPHAVVCAQVTECRDRLRCKIYRNGIRRERTPRGGGPAERKDRCRRQLRRIGRQCLSGRCLADRGRRSSGGQLPVDPHGLRQQGLGRLHVAGHPVQYQDGHLLPAVGVGEQGPGQRAGRRLERSVDRCLDQRRQTRPALGRREAGEVLPTDRHQTRLRTAVHQTTLDNRVPVGETRVGGQHRSHRVLEPAVWNAAELEDGRGVGDRGVGTYVGEEPALLLCTADPPRGQGHERRYPRGWPGRPRPSY